MSLAHWPQKGQLCQQSSQDLSAVEFLPVEDLLEESGG